MDTAITTQPSPDQDGSKFELMKMMIGNWISQSIYTAAKLKVVDSLLDEPKPVPVLATELSVQEGTLRRLLRALESIGLFQKQGDDCYAVTITGRLLASDRPDSLRPLALFNGESLYSAWAELPYAIRTGKSAFSKVHGADIFDFLEAHPKIGAQFDNVMAATHGAEAPTVIDAFDFSGFGTIIDIGGGKGSFVAEIVERHPGTHGIVYDLPHVIERAKEYLAERGLTKQCKTMVGNFFETVPEGGDAYLLRHIIHDWNDSQVGEILTRCRNAMRPDAKLIIVEAIIPSGPKAPASKMLDLNMLVICAGQERTVAEFDTLLSNNGFKLDAVHATESPRIMLIEASVAG